jgi:FtsP/CotA-like multicopper oxidase with cupredoxin domain
VKRRKYRFRFLGASISRVYEMSFQRSSLGPQSAVSLGYSGQELQGQYRLTDGQMALDFAHIANGGGLFQSVRTTDHVEVWPASRPQVVVDFTRYRDGTPTKKGDVIWLVNSLKMLDGRKPGNSLRIGDDPKYRVPMLKIVIGDDAPDASLMPVAGQQLRPRPALPSAAVLAGLPRRTFELQRGGFGGEIQWLINGHPFDPAVPLATMTQGQPEIWTIRNGGGGWGHPMHLHQEEHQILSRNGVPLAQLPGRDDDLGKDDVIDLDPSEEVEIYRNFRTFTGKYVAHCHNLAHEDHAMMFGWVIAK